MPNLNVSIFNDVLGPIMRGPSSSHTAAAVRIGQVGRALCHEEYKKVCKSKILNHNSILINNFRRTFAFD